jgi:uncharacterized protein YbjT (DUF2867 family)
MKAEILITGATGTVGGQVVKLLIRRGVRCAAAVHRHPLPAGAAGPLMTPIALDYRRPESFSEALAGARKVFLSTPVVRDQVPLAKRFIDRARAVGVQHLVYLSGLHARTAPSEHSSVHGQIEAHLEASGIRSTMLRSATFMQNLITFWLPGVLARRALRLPCGAGRINFVDARDVAAVVVEALIGTGHEDKAYALTGPRSLTLHDVAAALAGACGEVLPYVDVAPGVAANEMRDQGMDPWLIQGLLARFARYRTGHDAFVTRTIEALLGRPPTSIEQFAEDHARAFLRRSEASGRCTST